MTGYQQSILSDGCINGNLTQEEHNELRARILSEYPKWFTGTLLTDRLSDTLSWADHIAHAPSTRTVSVNLVAMKIDSLDLSSSRATATGSYEIHHVTATVVDGAGHEATDGGWVTLTFQAQLALTEVGWRFTNYLDSAQDYRDDPSTRSGQQYLPRPSEQHP